MFPKHGAFFSPSELTREVDCHSQNKLGDLQQTIFLFLQLGNYFLSVKQNYKPILSVGKGKNLRNPNLANTHKCNCHDMNWNDMDI